MISFVFLETPVMVFILALFLSDAYFMQMILYFCQPAVTAFRNLLICAWNMVVLGRIFNPRKTQCITFGRKQPTLCLVTLDDVNLEWSDKLKYLGCYFKSNTCYSDIMHRIRNYYGCLNNIMSVSLSGKGKNEMTAVHLVRTYCIPILTK